MPRSLVATRSARLLFLFVFSLMHAPALATAASTTGPFERWNAWWLHPDQGTLGIFPNGSSAIQIDRDGDGTAESLFLRPTGPTGIPDAAIGSLRLTPSRTIVYAFGGTCESLGTLVYFYRIPSFGDRLEPIRTGLCIPKGILQFGFYDTGLCAEPNGPGAGLDCSDRLGVSTQRIAWFATNATEFGFVNFVWVDLVTGTVSGPGFDFASNLGFVQVSPSGTQAFLQHDLGLPGETDYRLIDLCPGTLGTVINQGGFPISDVNAVLEAAVTTVSGGTVTIEVTRAPGSPPGPAIQPFDLSDCLDASGACCFADNCFDTGTIDQCGGGNFLGAGTACSACPPPPVEEACCFADGNPNCDQLTATACTEQGGSPQAGVAFCGLANCPMADPQLDLSGPTQAQVGDSVTYDFDYVNQGGVTAHNVEIEVQLPFGSTFVSATGGGDESGGLVRWVIGELAPAASGSVSVTFSLGCDVAQSTVLLQGLISQTFPPNDEGRSYNPSNQIEVEVAPVSSGPLTVSIATVPARVPLRPGDEQTHTVTLSNANGQSIEAVKLGRSSSMTPDGFDYGNAAAFDRVLSAAGGVVDTSGARFQWTGDVAAGQSASIQLVSQISSCVPPGVRETQLAFGDAIVAYDSCGAELGRSLEPATFAIEQVVDVEIGASNLAPSQRLVSPLADIGVQVTRPGGSANLSVSLGSALGQTLPGASVSFDLRGFDVTTPPSGAGVSYDAGTRSVAWSGTIPASGAVTIDLVGTVTACRAEINLEGSTSPGCTDIRANSVIAAVPVPPAGPWLASLTSRSDPFAPGSFEDQLIRITPGTTTQVTTMLCVGNEYSTGIGGAPSGDLWVGPFPLYRINPRTLGFQPFDSDRLRALGMLSGSTDVAVDPVDGTVYFAGARQVGFSSSALVLRYTPATDLLEPYFEDSTFQRIDQLVVDEQGRVAALAYTGGQSMLVRIDPGTPPSAQVLYDPTSLPLSDIALDRDGSYLVLEGFFGPTALLDVDPVSGATTSVVANLATLFPDALLWGEIDVDAQGDVFASPGQPGLTRITRATGGGETLLPIVSHGVQVQTLIDLAMVSLPIPEPGHAAPGGAALAALAALRCARSKRARS
jgi:uncharacterized repeat protein (TIGR01451 family)